MSKNGSKGISCYVLFRNFSAEASYALSDDSI
jgi:hypothetical protein